MAADALVDLRVTPPKEEKNDKKNKGSKEGRKEYKGKSSKWNKKKKQEAKAGGEKPKEGDSKFKGGCYLCSGPHRARDCPTKGKLGALVAAVAVRDSSDSDEPARAGTLQVLGAMSTEPATLKGVGLMYVPLILNGRKVSAMVDNGASHSFISAAMATELG